MRDSFIFQQNIYKGYIDAFNKYAFDILYGGNVIMASDIENDYKDIPADNE